MNEELLLAQQASSQNSSRELELLTRIDKLERSLNEKKSELEAALTVDPNVEIKKKVILQHCAVQTDKDCGRKGTQTDICFKDVVLRTEFEEMKGDFEKKVATLSKENDVLQKGLEDSQKEVYNLNNQVNDYAAKLKSVGQEIKLPDMNKKSEFDRWQSGERLPGPALVHERYDDARRRFAKHAIGNDVYWKLRELEMEQQEHMNFDNNGMNENNFNPISKEVEKMNSVFCAQFARDYLDDRFWAMNQNAVERALRANSNSRANLNSRAEQRSLSPFKNQTSLLDGVPRKGGDNRDELRSREEMRRRLLENRERERMRSRGRSMSPPPQVVAQNTKQVKLPQLKQQIFNSTSKIPPTPTTQVLQSRDLIRRKLLEENLQKPVVLKVDVSVRPSTTAGTTTLPELRGSKNSNTNHEQRRSKLEFRTSPIQKERSLSPKLNSRPTTVNNPVSRFNYSPDLVPLNQDSFPSHPLVNRKLRSSALFPSPQAAKESIEKIVQESKSEFGIKDLPSSPRTRMFVPKKNIAEGPSRSDLVGGGMIPRSDGTQQRHIHMAYSLAYGSPKSSHLKQRRETQKLDERSLVEDDALVVGGRKKKVGEEREEQEQEQEEEVKNENSDVFRTEKSFA